MHVEYTKNLGIYEQKIKTINLEYNEQVLFFFLLKKIELDQMERDY